jgi:hypothetical protein
MRGNGKKNSTNSLCSVAEMFRLTKAALGLFCTSFNNTLYNSRPMISNYADSTNVLVEWLTLLLLIQDAPDSNPGSGTGYHD